MAVQTNYNNSENALAPADLTTTTAIEPKHSNTPTIFAEPIFKIGGFTVTNSLITSWVAVALIIVLAVWLKRSLSRIPKGIQNVAEIIYEGALSLCDQVTNDRKISIKVFPLAVSIFLFVLLNNWIGILPGVGSVGFYEGSGAEQVFVPYLRGGTADLNTTLALAIFSVLGANVFGVMILGLWKIINKYVNIKTLSELPGRIRRDPTVLIVNPITFFVGLIELVGEFAKVASLSFRLFGNVFAGEVLLASMSAIFAFVLPVPFLFLEVFVGLIQAVIFSMLTTVYFTIAAQDHGHEESEAHHEVSQAEAH